MERKAHCSPPRESKRKRERETAEEMICNELEKEKRKEKKKRMDECEGKNNIKYKKWL